MTSLRLLIAEDSEEDYFFVVRAFEKAGYAVTAHRVEGVDELGQKLRNEAWDAVIADHHMPTMTSLQALETVKATCLDLPFVIVSGSVDEAFAADAMRAGAHDYIQKGRLARLVPAVEREIREAEARRARRRAELRLEHSHRHDRLTGLLNRAEMTERLGRVLEVAAEDGSRHTFVTLDLDGFRVVNETCSPIGGDAYLCAVTEAMREVVPLTDAFARVGGDEFSVLLDHKPLAEGEPFAHRLLERLHRVRFDWMDHSFEVRASVGVVEVGADSGSAEAVLSATNAACWAAKEQGGNRVRVYQEDDAELTRQRDEMAWVSRILRALDEERFMLHFQEIVPLAAATRRGHREILLRLQESGGRLISPGEFIPPAERFNLAPSIDRYVAEKLLRFLVDHGHDDGPTYFMNISGTSLSDPSFLDDLEALFRRQPRAVQRLGFEITETAAIRNVDRTVAFIDAMRRLGCRFALDDFGSGVSSFVYLRRFEADLLKIDGSFVREMPTDDLARAIVESLHRVARTIDMDTVAECVETVELAADIEAIGIEYAQGWAFHRPEPLPSS